MSWIDWWLGFGAGVSCAMVIFGATDTLGEWRRRRLHRRVDRLLLSKGESFFRDHYKR